MAANDVAGMLHLLKAEPTLLHPAPVNYTARDMEDRRHSGAHSCLRCGQSSQRAYVADTELGPRWLDLCAECDYWLRRGLDDLEREAEFECATS